MNKTIKIAFCSIVIALSVSVMIMASVLPVMTYACGALAGYLLLAVDIEISTPYAVTGFAIASILASLIAPDKEVVLSFIIFFGYYPIAKKYFDKLKSKPLAYLLKLLLFNVVAVTAFFVAKQLLLVSDADFTIFNIYLPAVFLVLGNVFFLVYDYATTLLIKLYIFKLHGVLKKFIR